MSKFPVQKQRKSLRKIRRLSSNRVIDYENICTSVTTRRGSKGNIARQHECVKTVTDNPACHKVDNETVMTRWRGKTWNIHNLILQSRRRFARKGRNNKHEVNSIWDGQPGRGKISKTNLRCSIGLYLIVNWYACGGWYDIWHFPELLSHDLFQNFYQQVLQFL